MALKMKPGVVTGTAYRDLVANCKDGGFALPAVNVVGTHSLNAVLEAAATTGSDIIIQLSNGGAQFFAGQGYPDATEAKVLGAVCAAHHVHQLAKGYGVCVVLHTDHANRKLLAWVERLIDHSEAHFKTTGAPLYSSHMIDLSEEPVADNLRECVRILDRLARIDISIEIELGVTGGEEDGVGRDLDDTADNPLLYTQPTDVLQAYDRLKSLGHFSVAASFGNVHGVYKPGNVKLRPDILKDSQDLVRRTHGGGKNPLDLVFHGGSGSDLRDIRAAIDYGVFKMNVDTDTQFAFAQPIGDYVVQNSTAFQHQIDPDTGAPQKKFYDPRKFLRAGEKGMVARITQALTDLGAKGKTVAR